MSNLFSAEQGNGEKHWHLQQYPLWLICENIIHLEIWALNIKLIIYPVK